MQTQQRLNSKHFWDGQGYDLVVGFCYTFFYSDISCHKIGVSLYTVDLIQCGPNSGVNPKS